MMVGLLAHHHVTGRTGRSGINIHKSMGGNGENKI